MNERIRELAVQARQYAWVNETHWSADAERATLFEQKFAELIVGECVKVAVFKDSGYIHPADVAGYMAAGRSTAAQMIKQHFGVE